ncbi:hypothetical protein TrLO_g1117 [Triparma laevis f. longispina]|uniref:Uncharacterized protein n=1 Tax=Triparma laevis f. longispina TaxID=1714387 RepID=A0A9W7C8U5_9STRA|nr:hypothetical protein TrLO_g1117 [Triparma laevis f. longispina]
MAFESFLCKTYGDDDTEWLIADRSIDCNSDFHKNFEMLSYLMILIYPIGITSLYSQQLWKHRSVIKNADDRDSDQSIQHIEFLWRDYRAEMWWFEIYECFRRLSFSGMLVFLNPGSAPQLCSSIILALISSLMYAYYKPFEKSEENTLAQVSTISIFLTLLAGIMISLKDKLAEENSEALGILLVFVNTLILGMVGIGFMYKPMFKAVKKLNEKHIHDAELKGMGEELAHSDEWFIDYFKRLAGSDEREAGWMKMNVKDWGGRGGKAKKNVKEWLDLTGALGEWRFIHVRD